MKRRGVTVLLGALITALLSVGVFAAPIPYVVLGPGPTVNTLGQEDGKEVIQVSGRATSSSAGQLRLTTVGVQPNAKLLPAVIGWFADDEAVVPRELVYPPGKTEKDVEQDNAEDFEASQTSAETAALRELGYPVQVVVKSVDPGGPSDGRLRAGDVITTVDGQPVQTAANLVDLIQGKPSGTRLNIGYTRSGAPATTTITSAASNGGTPRIGVSIDQQQPHPFSIKINLGDIGGPSAGLMFALGIVDKLRPEDVTGGKVIAGTGTIDDAGGVGPIGGIPQKLVAAKKADADVFLVPAENCAEAVRNAQPDLPLIRVGTLDEALAALDALRSGGQPARC
ncbi:MAG TPA: PDZ domain-containing protein [Micromonosporaceae bacterium]|nr:PDZ domain-containing protein [Micromonosporaceae bacterium]